MIKMFDKEKQTANEKHRLEEDVCIHIFTASATLVGVCLTVIGIFQIGSLKAIGSFADNMLAINAVGFLSSCALSYVALRTRTSKRRLKIEKVTDTIFLTSLALMAVICVLVAYEFM